MKDDLQLLYDAAEDIDLVTAEQLDFHDNTVYRMGGLVITSCYLKDVGLIGCVLSPACGPCRETLAQTGRLLQAPWAWQDKQLLSITR